MNVHYFSVESDLVHVNEWRRARQMKDAEPNDFPAVGFLVRDGNLPVACAFLRKVEGNYGIYDSQATNPAAPAAIRHEALNLLYQEMCREAKSLGLRHLIAHTSDNSTLERSLRYGFKQLLGTVISKDLSSGE